MFLARRSIQSVAWNSVANIVRVIILLIRSILLARWLDPAIFGIYAFAASMISISTHLLNFGMDGAFLHRSPETENEEHTAATHFTLTSIIGVIWGTAMALIGWLFFEGDIRLAMLVLTFGTVARQLTQTPILILTRRVAHKRLATLIMTNNIVMALVAIFLAWQGQTIWALLSTNVTPLFLNYFWLYLWKPVWRPRFRWAPAEIRYFLKFGSKNTMANLLTGALDRADDLWTGFYLGNSALGFYSRAYTFAGYPRNVIAIPINTVAGGTFAELKTNRKHLSQAFFRVNALLIRSSFFMGGLFALIAPEFIEILLGPKWLPMLNAFRLMLIFTLLDPIKVVISNLFIAMGAPERLVKARLIQLAVLATGLFTLGSYWGIAGVALAVNIMLVIGIGLLLWQAKVYVDFSWRQLFLNPIIAIAPAMIIAIIAIRLPFVIHENWYTASLKLIIFSTVYISVFLIAEPEYIQKGIKLLRTQLLK